MIPQRVKLSGFLSYKDEQEVRFDGSPLWMLSGTNGSGKSSIFDGVTFALFGHHRGGSTGATELVNKESNTLAVEFDFTVEKQLYRIKRTVRRRTSGVAGTQQVYRAVPPTSLTQTGATREVEWEPIADTQLKAKFDAWVRDTIGLDYETFTSSVLLLQGKSEKLLDSTPAGRASVLARIVDLERYQKLHGRADDKRRELKARLESLAGQLEHLRAVPDEELAAARDRIALAEEARSAAQERIDSLVTVELQARNWADKTKTLAAARAKLDQSEALLGSAVKVEREFARLRELRDVLPAVGVIVTERGRVGESERKSQRLSAERDGVADERRKAENALDQTRKKVLALKKSQAESEAKQQSLNGRLRELAGVLEKVRQAEDAEAEATRLADELARYPADPDAAVRLAQERVDALGVVSQVVPLLTRLLAERTELIQVAHREADARADEVRLKAEGVKLRAELDATAAELQKVRAERERLDGAAAEARALAQQARALADEFKELTGAKTCRACGQDLTPAHFESERKKRDLDAAVAERKAAAAAAAAAAAREKETTLTTREAETRGRVDELRDKYKTAAGDAKQAAAEAARLRESCSNTYYPLPPAYKQKIGPSQPTDWAATTYPDRVAVTALEQEAKGADGAKRELRAAQDNANAARTVRAKLDSARERLAAVRASLPAGDPAALRAEHATAQGEEQAVGNHLKGVKVSITAAEAETERFARQLSAAENDLTALAGSLQTEEVTRKHSQEAIERALKHLPAEWRKPATDAGMAERARWTDELEALTAADTEGKFTKLQAARGGLDSLRAEITTLDAEANTFPPEARRNPDEVKAEVAAARSAADAAARDLLTAQRDHAGLEDLRRRRGDLADQHKDADLSHARYKALAELLGRDRLQRHLVRKAERQIVDYGNAVLDRLSGGQLFLKLVGTEDGTGADKALDLECANRVTGGSPINVAFLSGSQRFRVAVALALGIGQYAGRQHRPIESVIIDEGFGCLDRAGRQVMIQELQNLRGHLHCILLVSHQEEFADAFPDGYRFELQDGATRVTRLAR
ncbi:AAA family ATPase [Urbifossiella limnaea]|uniref:Nuclease SbcCD subunit C n=1 Tax=Urbifossiella limnaea TaxID=2528023 RepID=A0A517XX80_9BACT|nr:SMC family ATPase [Urbifossiella limnaea]QDU22119.1 Nuclease SbcCD subunit C [Urbifossiella limnaea]